MANNISERSQMNLFVQTLYGVVLGVSLSNLKIDWSTLTSSIREPEPVHQRFQFFLILFTTVITAHDWFMYHLKLHRNLTTFKSYLPQIGSLFFLALMFNFSSFERIREWYIAGLLYTIFNLWSALQDPNSSEAPKPYPKYYLHLGIALAVIFLRDPSVQFMTKSWYYTIAFPLTVVAVVAIWLTVDGKAIGKAKRLSPTETINLNFLDLFEPKKVITKSPPETSLLPDEELAILGEIKKGVRDKNTITTSLFGSSPPATISQRQPLWDQYIDNIVAGVNGVSDKYINDKIKSKIPA